MVRNKGNIISEIEKFDSIAQQWWNPKGSFAPLHKVNPVRLRFILDCLYGYFDRNDRQRLPLEGLSILDIGCGGGLVCEPLARLGASLSGIDLGENTIKTAMSHAETSKLKVHYRTLTAEECVAAKEQYDVVLALEIIEHIDEQDVFINTTTQLVKEKGLVIYSTLNRTKRSFLFGILGAEYIFRWLDRNTHDWHKFVTPEELTQSLKERRFNVRHQKGLVYNPITGNFFLDDSNLSINYLLCAENIQASSA